ncbi:TPA: hypothetical protein JAN90_10635 [Legionella pneumophila]|nr:hypothetical protein [Legionella pneumophila]
MCSCSKELNASIQKALQNNHQIHLAMVNIESAQGQLQQVQLSLTWSSKSLQPG